jgi:hypothetical protein
MAIAELFPDGRAGSELLRERPAAAYTTSEQLFSSLAQTRLEELLRGETNALPLLRRYHREPQRLGVALTPNGIDRRSLRLPVVERIVTDLLQFLHAGTGAAGGPIAQWHHHGAIVERQTFTTRFPHIVIERTDRYDARTREPLETEWIVRRIQNQRADVRINRALDAANLGIELVKTFLRR